MSPQSRRLLKTVCENCGSRQRLEAHHKDRDFTNNTPGNVKTLCQPCHRAEHIALRGGLTDLKVIFVTYSLQLDRIDRWRGRQGSPIPSRNLAMRTLLDQALEAAEREAEGNGTRPPE